MRDRHIAIVGGGPMCTYAVERLAALLGARGRTGPVRLSVFERTGRFGAGEAHSDTQPPTSYMNRIAGQIALAADESNADAGTLLPNGARLTFAEWCRQRYALTGDEQFNIAPDEIPRRYVHGLALRDAFDQYVAILRSSGVTVDLYRADVVDLIPEPSAGVPYQIIVSGYPPLPADHVLLVTGHSHHRPSSSLTEGGLPDCAPRIAYPYPLETRLTMDRVPPGSVAGVSGLGLTAIDVLLYLSEGRGGAFVPGRDSAGRLEYVRSGLEPSRLIAFSPSGLLTSCRPQNAKGDRPELHHHGVFFTVEAVSALRAVVGTPAMMPDGELKRQLDFDAHLFPLVVLEMAYVYYKTLLGESFGERVRRAAEPGLRRFLSGRYEGQASATDDLLEPVDACFEEAVASIERGTDSGPGVECDGANLRQAFRRTLYGDSRTDRPSPWGHSPSIRDHRFAWRQILEPLASDPPITGEQWQARLTALVEKDLLHATQNNLKNPVKAACDGVWRDLRAVFGAAADRGGLTAASQSRFASVYMRYYNRLSNGSGIAAMRKILALLDAGLLDVAVGPAPAIDWDGQRLRVRGTVTGVVKDLDVLIDGKLHPFDPDRDAYALYPNLLGRGLIRKWRNPGQPPAADLVPGALDLTPDGHPVRADGSVDTRVTVLGTPAEGLWFFQQSAARPNANSYVLNNVARWATALVTSLVKEESA